MKRFSLADTTSRSPSLSSLLSMSPESTSRWKSNIGLIGQTTSTNAKMSNDVQTQMDLLKVHLQSLELIGNHSKDTTWTIGDRPTPGPDPSRFCDQENPEAIFPHPMPACLNPLCPEDEVTDELLQTASSPHLDNTSLDDNCQGTVGKSLNRFDIQYPDETTTEIENGSPNQAAIFQRPTILQLEAEAVESELQHNSIEFAALSPAKCLAASYQKVIEASSVWQETNDERCERIKYIPEEARCVASDQQTPFIQWTPPQDHVLQWTPGTDA